MKPSHPAPLAFAACVLEIAQGGPPSEIQLTPAGEFRAWDGRPADAPTWRINAALAARVIDWLAARKNPCVIDYEHQTLLAKKNGKPAPAAGWYSKLEWREGVGLFAIDIEWTAAAAKMIDAREYRFISPVIAYEQSGNVVGVYMAGLTNNPAIDGMDDLLLAAASAFIPSTNPEEDTMDELIEQLRWLLNLPVGATVEDIKAQLQKLQDQLGQTQTAAASFDLVNHLAGLKTQIAALSASPAAPDPAAFVPMAQFIGLQHQIASLSASLEQDKHSQLLQSALADGRILPANEAYWKAQPLAALSAYVAQAQPIAALAGTQSSGLAPAGAGVAALSAEAQAVCAQMGLTHDEFRAAQG